MRHGQLIEDNTRNLFLEKLYRKWGGEASPRLFYKKINLEHNSGSTVGNVIIIVFIVF